MAVIRLCGVRIPLTIFFRDFTQLGSSGLWYSILISNFVMVGVGMVFYRLISFEPRVKKVKIIPVALRTENPVLDA
jgi:Na+-driven multidrug efflux pump